MSLISVVLPTHNRAELLAAAIENLRAQTYSNWELIVVDDGSSDQTPEVIATAMEADERVTGLRNDPNMRLPRALNRGFASAKGDYLTWTSDDNLYLPRALEVMLAALDQSQHGLVYTSMTVVDDHLRPLRKWTAKPAETQPLLPWCGACFLYRREVLERVGAYAPNFFLAEDFDFWVRVRQQFSMGVIDEALYLYREHAESLSATRLSEARQQAARVAESHLPRSPWLTTRTYGETCLGLAEAALIRGDMRATRRWLRKAIPRCPDLILKNFKRGLWQAATRWR